MTDQTQTTTEPVAYARYNASGQINHLLPEYRPGYSPLYTTPQPLAVGPDRARVTEAVHAWMREDASLATKLNLFPDVRDKLVNRLLALAAPAEGWQGIETAPKDGTVIIAMARYTGATAGFPCFVAHMHGAWRELGRTIMEPMVCWAWKPRDILGEWPCELPAAPTGETGT